MSFTSVQLQAIRALLAWRIERYGDTSKKHWGSLLIKAGSELAASNPGTLVFRLELPTEPFPIRRGRTSKPVHLHLAPTMNEYAGQTAWMRALVRKELDERIAVAKFSFPRWSCSPKKSHRWVADRVTAKGRVIPGAVRSVVFGGDHRIVRVTRRSSRRLDEPSTDAIGGKIPIDRLAIADILAGDSAKWISRQAVWEAADPGEGSILLEVFALAEDPVSSLHAAL